MPETPESLVTLAARVTEMEMLYTHLERRVQDLNDVVTALSRQIEHLTLLATRVATAHESMSARLAEVRDPAEEKPPHY